MAAQVDGPVRMRPTQFLIALAALLVAALLVWSWRRRPVEPAQPPAAASQPESKLSSPSFWERVAAPHSDDVTATDEPASASASVVEQFPDGFGPSAPGTLEVEVWLGEEPLAGAEVVAAPNSALDLADRGWNFSGPMVLHQSTAADGVARFMVREVGPYGVAVRLHERVATASAGWVDHNWSRQRVVLRFGTGGVEGTLFDADGVPLGERAISVETVEFAERSAPSWSDTRTDELGRYRVGQLPACSVLIIAGACDEFPDDRPASARVQLAEGEWKRVDLGSDQPDVRWRGRLRTNSGANIDVPQSILLNGIATGFFAKLDCADDGSFDISLPADTYGARWETSCAQRELGEVELHGATLQRDLVVPGAFLSGRVTYVGQRPELTTYGDWLRLSRRSTGSESFGLRAGRNGERYWFSGLEPGEYRITTSPHPRFVNLDDGATVTITPDRDVYTLDLSITNR